MSVTNNEDITDIYTVSFKCPQQFISEKLLKVLANTVN